MDVLTVLNKGFKFVELVFNRHFFIEKVDINQNNMKDANSNMQVHFYNVLLY